MNAFKYQLKPYSIAWAECKVVGLIKQKKTHFTLVDPYDYVFVWIGLAQDTIPFHINSLLTITDFCHNHMNVRILVYYHIP